VPRKPLPRWDIAKAKAQWLGIVEARDAGGQGIRSRGEQADCGEASLAARLPSFTKIPQN